MREINIEDIYIKAIKSTIKRYLPSAEIYFFGSRVAKNNEKYSDVDISIRDKKLTFEIISKIEFQLNESNMPFKVDINDYDSLPDYIRKTMILVED
jgi:uncharacterized protein